MLQNNILQLGGPKNHENRVMVARNVAHLAHLMRPLHTFQPHSHIYIWTITLSRFAVTY